MGKSGGIGKGRHSVRSVGIILKYSKEFMDLTLDKKHVFTDGRTPKI
jgi:hypothetical protein